MSDFLLRAQNYCAKAERCRQDVVRRLWVWKVPQEERGQIITSLENDGFIDENRYANAFVHDKVELSGWGMRKIKNTLISKGISNDTIENAMSRYEQHDDTDKLVKQLDSKAGQLLRTARFARVCAIDPDGDDYEARKVLYDFRNRLLRFAVARGFDVSVASQVIEQLLNDLRTK
ncbi:MAG: RecX family transcriptional regulator [Paludibacteraceae bacterium]|nr:RecX family transcriptional regulator [Paludibacteraceae bacterium]